jgi:tetratricopeptide (TPR) repeat protein
MRNLFIACFIVGAVSCYSQERFDLVKPLDKTDTIFLKQEARVYAFLKPTIQFEYNTTEFSASIKTAEKGFDPEEVKRLKAKLTGNYDDAEILYNLGYIYKQDFQYNQAGEYFQQALDKGKDRAFADTTNAEAWRKLGTICFGANLYDDAFYSYGKALRLDSNNVNALTELNAAALVTGKVDLAEKLSMKKIKLYPDSVSSYFPLPVIYLYKVILKANALQDDEQKKNVFRNKTPDQYEDISAIRSAFEKHPKDYYFEFLYRVSLYCMVIAKCGVYSMADTTTKLGDFPFVIEEKDLKDLKMLQKFFEKGTKDKKFPCQYALQKSLANIYVMQKEFSKGKAAREKAIALKEAGKINYSYNAAIDYDNLGAIYLLEKDTVGFEKLMLRKIKARPALNPDPSDYVKIAQIAVNRGDIKKAKEYAVVALDLSETAAGANLVLGTCALLEGNMASTLKYFQEENKIEPESASLMTLVGIFSLLNNNPDNAADWFSGAMGTARYPDDIQKDFIDRFLAPIK